jgi:hypothetical protein
MFTRKEKKPEAQPASTSNAENRFSRAFNEALKAVAAMGKKDGKPSKKDGKTN